MNDPDPSYDLQAHVQQQIQQTAESGPYRSATESGLSELSVISISFDIFCKHF